MVISGVIARRRKAGSSDGRPRRRAEIRGQLPHSAPLHAGYLPVNDVILREIADFCRRTGVAESTFGRRAVNDGKLASRLRNGGRITTDTLDRIRAFMAENVSGEA